jgi:hypothetical protein
VKREIDMAFKFNPFSGTLDWTLSDAKVISLANAEAVKVVSNIATSSVNALGNPNFFYDATACKWVEAGPQVVTDEDGVVVIDEDSP